jgi:RNA recognition motif-containing protein
MNTRLYVGNLAPSATEMDLRVLFSPYGNVAEISFPVEHERGRRRGFAIVTMATPHGTQAAMLALNGKEVQARVLTVTEARPCEQGAACRQAA